MSGPTLRLNAKKAAPPSHAGGAFPNAELLVQLVDMGYSVEKASKALIETGSKHLAAALDWLEMHPCWEPEDDIARQLEQFQSSSASAAQLSAPAPVELKIESRVKEDDKQAFLERQRQKEIERLKKAKAEQAAEAERVKREAERERQERRMKMGLSPDETPAAPQVDAEAEQRRVEEKLRAQKAEEDRRRREVALLDKKEILLQLEEDKKRRMQKFGLDEKEILTPEEQKKQFEEKQKEKAKYQWKKDAEADRAERERLRRQLEEDRQARAAKTLSAEQAAEEIRKQQELTKQLAEARRARLGVSASSSTAAESTDSPAESSSTQEIPPMPAPDISPEEAARREEARLARLARLGTAEAEPTAPAPVTPPNTSNEPSLQEIQRRRFEENRRRAQMEEERIAREKQLEKLLAAANNNAAAAPITKPATPPPSNTPNSAPALPSTDCEIQLRLPNGVVVKQTFKSTDSMKEVHDYAAAWQPLHTLFNLFIPFPRKEFDEHSLGMSIREAGLVPRGTLTVMTLQSRGVVTQAAPEFDDDDMDTETMDYEQLLALENQVGKVQVGLTDEEIAKLPSAFWPVEKADDLCAICRDTFKDGDRVNILPCKHTFHHVHISQWLRDTPSCPVCKRRAKE